MYRIKLPSGEETVFSSLQELTVGVQSGIVTPTSLIYHARADRWLEIRLHPHYQLALAGRPTAASGAKQPAQPRRPTPSTGTSAPGAAPRPQATMVATPAFAQSLAHALEAESSTEAAPPGVTPPVKKSRTELEFIDLGETKPATPESKPDRHGHPNSQPWEMADGFSPGATMALAPEPPRKDAPRPAAGTVSGLLASEAQVAGPIDSAHLEAAAPSEPKRKRKATGVLLGVGVIIAVGTGVTLPTWRPWVTSSLQSARPSPTVSASASVRAPTTLEVVPSVSEAPLPLPSAPAAGAAPSSSAPVSGPAASVPVPRSASLPAAGPVDSAPPPAPLIRPAPAAPHMVIAAPTIALAPGAAPAAEVPTISGADLARHYAASTSEARARMDSSMSQIGFNNLLAPGRLSSGDNLQGSRRVLGAATSVIRAYRNRDAAIDRAYQDSLRLAGGMQGLSAEARRTWITVSSQRESPSTIQLTETLLSQTDTLLGLLLAQQGKYQIEGPAIAFKDAAAAREYSVIRTSLARQLEDWGSNGSAMPATMQHTLRAIGKASLPVEKN